MPDVVEFGRREVNLVDKQKVFDAATKGFLEIATPDSQVSAENIAKAVANAVTKALEEYEKHGH